MEVPFNKPLALGEEEQSVLSAIRAGRLSGDGPATRRCCELLAERVGCRKAVLTPSCTAALEMAALLAGVGSGDEVIMPSYTFVTTASAFALRGARIVWCDIRPDTKNLDERRVESLVTDRTKVLVAVHYAGVACEMDTLVEISRRRGLLLVADAAQAIDCTYKGRPLGGLGDLATLSFHDTKNIHCGEGGALLVNDERLVGRAEVVRDKGTNRQQFVRGLVDKYTWGELGSSFLASELQAAFLMPQLRRSREVNDARLGHWRRYHELLSGFMPPDALPVVPDHCAHNGHMFYVLLDDDAERDAMIAHLAAAGVSAYFHYVPLHLAPYWRGGYDGAELPVTLDVAGRLLRLPMFHALTAGQIEHVCRRVEAFKPW